MISWLRVSSALHIVLMLQQYSLAQDSVEKTTFVTNLGQWEYLVMPFGLCNAPGTFQRLMNEIFKKEINSFVLVYLDDILIYSRSEEEHWEHLAQRSSPEGSLVHVHKWKPLYLLP